jgi:hypothetical protein
MILQRNKSFWVVMLLLAVPSAEGSPVVRAETFITPCVHTTLDATDRISYITNDPFSTHNAELANLRTKFLQPPAGSVALSDVHTNYIKPLPAVPTAILMVIIGFLCVSLVRDRRLWLVALTGVLSLGHMGIQTIPQLFLRLSYRNHIHQKPFAKLACLYFTENSHRLRSDIDGTQYVGLLHHLAGIPKAKSTSTITQPEQGNALAGCREIFVKVFSYFHKNTRFHLSAIIPVKNRLNLLFKCLALRAKQLVCFSPAFIFEQLARGPPQIT